MTILQLDDETAQALGVMAHIEGVPPVAVLRWALDLAWKITDVRSKGYDVALSVIGPIPGYDPDRLPLTPPQ